DAPEHPLRVAVRGMLARGRAEELRVSRFGSEAVAQLAELRLGGKADTQLTAVLAERTGGNPPFLTSLLDELIDSDALEQDSAGFSLRGGTEASSALPRRVRDLLAWQIEQLEPAEQRLLEAASVVGASFAVAAVAAAVEAPPVAVEASCDSLVGAERFIRRETAQEWPGGTVSAVYSFEHALHRDAWNERTAPARKQELHGRIAERLERGFGDRTIEIAAELARHFEHGGDLQRAATYLQQASQLALSRLAFRDAGVHLERALALLQRAHPGADPIAAQ